MKTTEERLLTAYTMIIAGFEAEAQGIWVDWKNISGHVADIMNKVMDKPGNQQFKVLVKKHVKELKKLHQYQIYG